LETVALNTLRLGIDLGGTKIAGVALDPARTVRADYRQPAPRDDYRQTIAAIAGVITRLETDAGCRGSIGIGMPGCISPATGLVQNSNSTWLNGQPLKRDLEAHLGRPVRMANDANCFALSEATDGAGQGALSVFGVIIGTGCGGGLVHQGRLIDGPRGIGGEWGHNPLPRPSPDELPGPQCYCGRDGCMETWVSGPALAADHARVTGEHATAETIAANAAQGDAAARATLHRHADRLARGLGMVINIFDPDVIVLGGGLSKLDHLYDMLPRLTPAHIFADHTNLSIRPPRWGDASGVRGAAWLWD
jgi:fructokinase